MGIKIYCAYSNRKLADISQINEPPDEWLRNSQ